MLDWGFGGHQICRFSRKRQTYVSPWCNLSQSHCPFLPTAKIAVLSPLWVLVPQIFSSLVCVMTNPLPLSNSDLAHIRPLNHTTFLFTTQSVQPRVLYLFFPSSYISCYPAKGSRTFYLDKIMLQQSSPMAHTRIYLRFRLSSQVSEHSYLYQPCFILSSLGLKSFSPESSHALDYPAMGSVPLSQTAL